MDAVNLQQLYDCDPRPTFVVSIDTGSVCHVNKALLAIPQVANALRDVAFYKWWDPGSEDAYRGQDEFVYGCLRWYKFTACDRWLIVTAAIEQRIAGKSHDAPTSYTNGGTSPSFNLTKPAAESIFTSNIQSAELREHLDHICRTDWAATSLGPMDTWSDKLNQLVTLMMLETRPTALFLGPDNNIIYNVPYAKVSGSRHPSMFGQNVIEAWPEIEATVRDVLQRAHARTFVDSSEEEFHHMVQRNGYLEETFFLWTLVPLVGSGVDGMYSMVTETTKQRLLERRVNSVLRIGELTGSAVELEAFWSRILQAIQPYEYDFPLAMLYSTLESDTASSAGSAFSGSRSCTLEGTVGYKDAHPAIPKWLDLESDHGLARVFNNAVERSHPLLVQREDGLLDDALFTDIQKRGFGDHCKAFIVIPVQPVSREAICGFLVIGLNTRRPYDLEYREWIQIITKLLGASAASVVLHEDEIRSRKRAVEQAARDKAMLKDELAVVTREANDISDRLQMFHDVANKVGLGYFEYSTNGKLQYANDAFFVQNGHATDLQAAPEFSFIDRIYTADIDLTMKQWYALVAGTSVKFEMRWKRDVSEQAKAKGDTRDYTWILSACVPVKLPDGTVVGISGCNTDITAQKESTQIAILRAEAQERARNSEIRLLNYTQISPVAICRMDPQLNIQYCNTKWFDITAHPVVPFDQIIWPPVIYEEDLPGVYEGIQVITRQKSPHTFFFRTKKLWTGPDGVQTPTWLLATGTAELDNDGNVAGILATMTDVSQLRWAEDIQKVRVEEALESKRQQENFIDMTSHEMRNPLSAMVQCADSISSSLDEMMTLAHDQPIANSPVTQTKFKALIGSSIEALETIQACATHQKRIVDDILTLSKLDSKLLTICPIIMKPSVLLQDTYKMFKDEASKAGVELAIRSEPNIQQLEVDWAILDPSRVLQVLINLITNAIKFTQNQAIRTVEVTIGASKSPDKRPDIQYVPSVVAKQDFLSSRDWGHGDVFYLHFTVRDTGCGLTPEHMAKLFLRFSQATPRTHVQYGGSGLGLFISRELTEMQGGSIGVQSEQGVGSTFTFFIKSRKAGPPNTHDLPSRSKADIIKNTPPNHKDQSTLVPSAPTQPLPVPTKLHILVVEDNVINQRVLCSQLKKLGHTVQVAGHGGEALEELRKTTYWKYPTAEPAFQLSVVLMDVEMPVMDGLECTRRIRELQATGDIVGHVPVIAVSANARREQIEQAKEAGMDDTISKPFRIPELIPKIQRLVDAG